MARLDAPEGAGALTLGGVLDLLDASVGSAAVGAALELGLLESLAREPLDAAGVGRRLGIPGSRASVWLHLLERARLIELADGAFAPTAAARSILGTFSPETWALLAIEARERRDGLVDLPRRLRAPAAPDDSPDYVATMAADPDRARRFTRMLFELHAPLARAVVAGLDLRGVGRVLDVGGGSGVVSMALARRHPRVECTVVDIASVCEAGRRIAGEQGLGDRVAYLPADLTRDPLPTGVDLVLECDVGLYEEGLFRRVLDALRPGGRFVILDRLAASPGEPPPNLAWALTRVLAHADHEEPTVSGIEAMLRAVGFVGVAHRPLSGDGSRAEDDPFGGQTVIEATAPGRAIDRAEGRIEGRAGR